ncbi:hypothetical protein SEA_MACGULLY_80 [Rhodococcus phage MacGully]|nr:hypothetical protein SEA_MACGULLY_80 [Rhodococcus phage MacGully]
MSNYINGVPHFAVEHHEQNGERVCPVPSTITYEVGHGGRIENVVGWIVEPEDQFVEKDRRMVSIYPKRSDRDQPLQERDRAKLVEINKDFIIQIATIWTKEEDTEDGE